MKFIQQIWNICLAKIFIWFHLNLIPKWHISPKKWLFLLTVFWFSIYTAKFRRCWQKEAFECCLAVVINTLVALHLYPPDRQIGVSALCSDRDNDNAAHGS